MLYITVFFEELQYYISTQYFFDQKCLYNFGVQGYIMGKEKKKFLPL